MNSMTRRPGAGFFKKRLLAFSGSFAVVSLHALKESRAVDWYNRERNERHKKKREHMPCRAVGWHAVDQPPTARSTRTIDA